MSFCTELNDALHFIQYSFCGGPHCHTDPYIVSSFLLEATFFAPKSAHSIVEGNTVGCWSLQKGRCCAHECVLRLEVLRG